MTEFYVLIDNAHGLESGGYKNEELKLTEGQITRIVSQSLMRKLKDKSNDNISIIPELIVNEDSDLMVSMRIRRIDRILSNTDAICVFMTLHMLSDSDANPSIEVIQII